MHTLAAVRLSSTPVATNRSYVDGIVSKWTKLLNDPSSFNTVVADFRQFARETVDRNEQKFAAKFKGLRSFDADEIKRGAEYQQACDFLLAVRQVEELIAEKQKAIAEKEHQVTQEAAARRLELQKLAAAEARRADPLGNAVSNLDTKRGIPLISDFVKSNQDPVKLIGELVRGYNLIPATGSEFPRKQFATALGDAINTAMSRAPEASRLELLSSIPNFPVNCAEAILDTYVTAQSGSDDLIRAGVGRLKALRAAHLEDLIASSIDDLISAVADESLMNELLGAQ